MGDELTTSSPLYHPATAPGRDDRLHALADDVARARKTRWVRETSKLHPDRLAQWAATKPGSPERTALEERFANEDDEAADAGKKLAGEEEDRRRRVVEARQRLRG